MKSLEVRNKFFEYFKKRGHEQVSSSSLIPAQDPTLLFANAGMNQFTDVFLGTEKRSYSRATSIQKCVRAGGKHNDLDNVGFTKRHLTFFEMMGNFSFGDYFKKEAIEYAWEFLTVEMKLPKDKLHASVFETDDESYDLWVNMIGLPKERVHRLGAKDNFWQMGDTGPCGPCSELHIDRGPDFGCDDCDPACECDRYLEIWNLVFMQYDRQPDGKDNNLKRTGVDTGMGLERLCAVVQDKESVFHTDLFTYLIEKIEHLTGKPYAQQDPQTKAAYHVMADHVRSAALIIADGGSPSNEGRGYVLRKIIRRGALFAQKLTDKNIFPELAKTFIDNMGDIYPELSDGKELIISVLESEIEKFAVNLVRGQNILEDYFKKNQKTKTITGEQAFKLYDTFGFPTELIVLIAQEKDFAVDMAGFEKEMSKQKKQSGKKATVGELAHLKLPENITTEFKCYETLTTESPIIALVKDGTSVDSVKAGEACYVITERSPFFIEGGGQITDQGWLIVDGKEEPILGAKKHNGAILVHVKAPTNLKVGDEIKSVVNEELRTNAMKNHTATHLLQSALMQLFGKQIKQSGSLVAPDYLRFDFAYHKNLSPADIVKVEELVNQKITENIQVNISQTTYKDAVSRGVIAFFGDKYNPDNVRVVDVPGFSAELCGGTHVNATGDIGAFKITESTALSAGHRRVVAVTGPKAVQLFQESFNSTKQLSQEFKVKREEVVDAVLKQKEQLKSAQTQLKQLKKQLYRAQVPTWNNQVETIAGVPFLFVSLTNATSEELRDIAQQLSKGTPGFYFVISVTNNSSLFVTTVSQQHADAVDLKKFGAWLKDEANLRGGGSQNALQGGGEKFKANLADKIRVWLKGSQS